MARVIFESEKELEDYIFSNIEDIGICPISDDAVDFVFRQFNLGDYGVPDIIKIKVTDEGDVIITVLELKKDEINIKAIGQVMRYVTGIKEYIDLFLNKNESDHVFVNAEVCGTSINLTDDTCYLLNSIDGLCFYEVSCCLDNGFLSTEKSYGWHKEPANLKERSDIYIKVKRMLVERIINRKKNDTSLKIVKIKKDA